MCVCVGESLERCRGQDYLTMSVTLKVYMEQFFQFQSTPAEIFQNMLTFTHDLIMNAKLWIISHLVLTIQA